MKFTLAWLKEHLETDASLAEITETLTRIGLEVENVDNAAEKLAAYRVASVISAEKHPNADRLRVCMVDAGDGTPVQVVCGAPNARTGMKSVFAAPGTFIPGKNMMLTVGTIRGVESRGMLCSAAELEISDDHEGIIDLPADAPVGTPYATYAGLDDPMIEVAVTPNRADALGVAGIARDLAAAGLGKIKTPDPSPFKGEGPCPVDVQLAFSKDDAHLCPAFALRLVRGVENGPSPPWLQRRLRAIGLRPINTLVDVTNYITFDRGRPLHVFDAAKVKGDLTVRRGKRDESLIALDGKTYPIDEDIVVIADQQDVESLAGIMGGEASGCSEATTDVLIESALWDPLNIAQTGRRLGVVSDARYRFERGVDPDFCIKGLDLATRMVISLVGGKASEMKLAGAIPDTGRIIDFPWSEVKRLTGLELPLPQMRLTLGALGFHVSGTSGTVKVSPPSWRADIEGKADLVEEIVRIAGLDQVPAAPLPRVEKTVVRPVLTVLQKRTRLAKRLLAARGMVEAVTWSFIGKEEAKLFGGGGNKRLALANPIAVELSDMRPNLLPGLLKAAQRNADRGVADVALFEVGQIFTTDEADGQFTVAAAVRRGSAHAAQIGRHWRAETRLVDVFDAKADAMALLIGLGVSVAGVQVDPTGPDWYHPGRSAILRFGRTEIGAFGEVHPKLLEALDVKGPLVACELTLEALPLPKHRPTKMRPKLSLSEFQPVTRDFAFVVDSQVPAGDIVRAAAGVDRALVSDVDVFDIYQGANVGDGKKSIAVAVTLQPMEKTLTDQDIDAVSARIVEAVSKRTGATLRS
jgi:phenylalanyl-tRNA synthetase beta chain